MNQILTDSKPNQPEYSKTSGEVLLTVWVDQYCGVCDDDYYGDVYIEIEENKKYLKWYYSM